MPSANAGAFIWLMASKYMTKDQSTSRHKPLLIVFCKNPVLGLCKTRLAATIGDAAALSIYEFLLNHTATICSALKTDKQVFYSHSVNSGDCWPESTFQKKIQCGSDLGQRMNHAFAGGFDEGYTHIVLIGTDLYDLDIALLENAFEALKQKEVVIGPSEDGGYYLIGLSRLNSELFNNKNWSTSSVLSDTLSNLPPENYHLLPKRNDIDTEADLHPIDVFKPFL